MIWVAMGLNMHEDASTLTAPFLLMHETTWRPQQNCNAHKPLWMLRLVTLYKHGLAKTIPLIAPTTLGLTFCLTTRHIQPNRNLCWRTTRDCRHSLGTSGRLLTGQHVCSSLCRRDAPRPGTSDPQLATRLRFWCNANEAGRCTNRCRVSWTDFTAGGGHVGPAAQWGGRGAGWTRGQPWGGELAS